MIIRNDSNEQVGGIGRQGASREDLLASIEKEISVFMLNIRRPPPEWQKLEVRKIIVEYHRLNYELTSNLARLNASLRTGKLSEDELHEGFWRAREEACKGGASLALKIASLVESDRINLMTSPEEFYGDADNPWYMDDLDARSALFDFIINPSPEVMAAHQAHVQKWG